MTNDKPHFRNLDAIRFFAAMMVFVGHGISPGFPYLAEEGSFGDRLLGVIGNGGAGVSVFFVLSGFLITFLLIREHEGSGRIAVGHFYLRRVLRIWPLYFLVVALSFGAFPLLKILTTGAPVPLGSNFFYHLTFLSNFDVLHIEHTCPGSDAMSQNITWSVSIEEQFYLVWPLLFAFLPRRAWLSGILVTIAGSLVFRLLNSGDESALYFHTLAVLSDLGIGGLTAYLVCTNGRFRTFFEHTPTAMHAFYFLLSFSLLCWGDELFAFPFGAAAGRIPVAVSFALIIAAQALSGRPSPLHLSNVRFAERWGKYTYGIYLIHPIALTVVNAVADELHWQMDGFSDYFFAGLLALAVTVVSSYLSYHYFESVFLRLKEKYIPAVTRRISRE